MCRQDGVVLLLLAYAAGCVGRRFILVTAGLKGRMCRQDGVVLLLLSYTAGFVGKTA